MTAISALAPGFRDRLNDDLVPTARAMNVAMAAQAELVDVVHSLKQVMCIKGALLLNRLGERS